MRRIDKTCSWWTTSLGLVAAMLVVAACGGQTADLGSKASTTGRQMLLSDSNGTIDVTVTSDTQCATKTTASGAIIDYIGDNCTDLGAAGTGLFESFVRLQASPNEQGYNTDAKVELDTSAGTWTHAEKVSDIPVVMYNGHPYWELYSDINESNSTPYISLNKLKVFFTSNANLTGYSQTTEFGTNATKIYDFSGKIEINDVNAGSGRADLRYRIPLDSIDLATLAPNCGYKNTTCNTYFVLYTQWGATSGSDQWASDGGFEEWKVKTYPYVTVAKTGTTTFTRTFAWTIGKSVTPDTWNLFTGDSGQSRYTVTVAKDSGTDSNFAASGTITINNPGTLDAVITGLPTDSMAGATVTCPTVTSWPYTLAAGQTLNCTYSTTAGATNPAGQTNTATVTLAEGTLFTGSVTITAGTTPSTVVNDTIHVTDTYQGSLGAFSASGTANYNRTFTCDADQGTKGNTATITETAQSASASVTVNCYGLGVTKTANTSLTRTYAWDLSKSADQSSVTLASGEQLVVNYTVIASVTSGYPQDSAWAANGSIVITNNNPSLDATVNSVADVITGPVSASVVCPGTAPYTIAKNGGTLTCTYSASLPDGTARTNTATATLQNHSYPYSTPTVGTATGTTPFSNSPAVAVSFGSPTITYIDECVNVTDTLGGTLGTVCAANATPGAFTAPHTFTYTYTITGPATCGNSTVDNTATETTTDTSTVKTASWTVNVNVPCLGCTLTQGYWKTHSSFGPAPYDDTWAQLPSGASTTFFLSGTTWYNVFWTPPKGNGYYNLAHQYEAAVLNVLTNTSLALAQAEVGGTGVASVDAALLYAFNFFSSTSPSQWSSLTKAQQQAVIQNAGILGSYNQGSIGPGHCTEDRLSSTSP